MEGVLSAWEELKRLAKYRGRLDVSQTRVDQSHGASSRELAKSKVRRVLDRFETPYI